MRNQALYKFIFIFLSINILIACSKNKSQENQNTLQATTTELTGTICISGAFALYPMTTKWAAEFQKLHPKVRIDISAGGAGKGMTDALSGIVDLGMFSRGITDVEKSKGVWWIAVAQDAVLPTINSQSPVFKNVKEQGLTRQDFIDIYLTKEITNWGKWSKNIPNSDVSMNIYTRSDACGAAEMWGEYLGGNQESLNGIGIYGDPGMADAVKKDQHGIGYNNIIFIYDIQSRNIHQGIEVIPIDLDENGKIDPDEYFYDKLDKIMLAIKEGVYPSPPSRDLYFVSKGKPQNKVIIEFLNWIVTNGQAFVNEAGYVQISQTKLQEGINKLTE